MQAHHSTHSMTRSLQQLQPAVNRDLRVEEGAGQHNKVGTTEAVMGKYIDQGARCLQSCAVYCAACCATCNTRYHAVLRMGQAWLLRLFDCQMSAGTCTYTTTTGQPQQDPSPCLHAQHGLH
jgi:hypothetical protein